MDASNLINAVSAINALVVAGVMTKRTAAAARKELSRKIGEAMSYWSDKEQWDIVEGLNAAYRKVAV